MKDFAYNSSLIEKNNLLDVYESNNILININRSRKCTRITEMAEQIHREVIQDIREILPKEMQYNFETEVYENPDDFNSNRILAHAGYKDGKLVIFLNSDPLFYAESSFYQGIVFPNLNGGRDVSFQDFFKNVLAHEYGHILFEDKILEDIGSKIPYRYLRVFHSLDQELSEGFAFWFGDTVSKLKWPLESLIMDGGYSELSEPEEIIKVYNELQKMSYAIGFSETLKRMQEYIFEYSKRREGTGEKGQRKFLRKLIRRFLGKKALYEIIEEAE